MATQPTNNPVPSESPRDLKFNAGKIDEFVTSLVTTYIDRFGNEHYTIEGLNQLARQAIAAFGWIPVGTFQAGATISLPNQILKDTSSGEYYRWDGALPKVVPSGSTPASTGGTGIGAWISVGDSALRSMLAATTGAGLVGYSASVTYPAGTVGEALGPFKATGGTRKVSREDRASFRYGIYDFNQYPADAGAAVNAAILKMREQQEPGYADNRGGSISLPRGRTIQTTSIDVSQGQVGLSAVSIEGEGMASTHLDMQTASPGTDGIILNEGIYGELKNFTVARSPRRAVSFIKGRNFIIKGVEAYLPSADGFYFGNTILSHIEKCSSLGGSSHGFSYDDQPRPAGNVTQYEKTSITSNTNYAKNNAGSGFKYGNFNYSVSFANGSDLNGQNGYQFSGSCWANASIADGAESNQRCGFYVAADRADSDIQNLTIQNAYAYNNNVSNNGYPNLLSVLAGNGGKARVKLDNCYSRPNGPGASTPDVIANGNGAVIELHGNCTLPNGWATYDKGYIDYVPITLLTNKTVPVGTGTPICSLKNTQGYVLRYAGIITIVVGNAHPQVADRETSIYHLLVSRTAGGGANVQVIGQAGRVSSTGNSSGWPSFIWSHHSSTNTLVATPQAGVGGVEFWFEITTASQIVASKI